MDIGLIIEGIRIAMPIITALAPVLQKTMAGFAERLLTLSEKYPGLEEFANMIGKAAEVMGDILYALGIESDSAAELGFKATQTDKKMEDFDTVAEYVEYLRNEITLDKEKFDALSEEEILGHTINGVAIQAGAINEKLGVEISADLIELAGKIKSAEILEIDAKTFVDVIEKLKDAGIVNLDDVVDYLKGEGDSDRVKTGKALLEALNEVTDGKGAETLGELIDAARK